MGEGFHEQIPPAERGKGVDSFVRTAVTKNHPLRVLTNRKALSHGSGVQKSKIKVLEGCFLLRALRGAAVPGLSPSFLGFAGGLGCTSACGIITPTSAFMSVQSS